MSHCLAWYSLASHIKFLRLLGLYQLDPKTTPRLQYHLHQTFMCLMFCLSVIYSIQSCIYMYQVRSDVNKVIDSMFLFLTFVTCIYKQLVLRLKEDLLENVLDILKGALMNPEEKQHKKLLSLTAKRAKATLYIFYCLSQSTAFTYVMFPIIVRLKGGSTEFPIWLPFDEQRFYYGVLFYTWLQATLVGSNSSTVDVFVAFLLAQCKTQLSILRSDLETLVERSREFARNESITYERAVQQLLTLCLQHYTEIIRLALGIEKIFGGALLFQFLVTGWIICTTAYRCINMDPASVEFFSMILYMCCILVEIFLFCYYGNELTHESLQLTNSVYTMNWLMTKVGQRRSILIFMERIKRPIQPLAGQIIPLSLSTYISILRSSYTFYAVLKSTEE